MKIHFLGTSHGVPSAERYCSCTMLEIGSTLYCIDAGAPLMDILLRMRKAPEDVRAVFTTHIHGDHTDGLLSFMDLCNWYFKQAKPILYFTENAGIECFRNLVQTVEGGGVLDMERIQMRLMTPETVYADENIRVTPIPTKHMLPNPSYAYRVEAEGKTLLFTGDMSVHLAQKDFPYCPADLTVCEMAHFTIDDAVPYLEKLPTKRLYVNHVSGLNKFEDIAALSGKYGYPVTAPNDGDVVEL